MRNLQPFIKNKIHAEPNRNFLQFKIFPCITKKIYLCLLSYQRGRIQRALLPLRQSIANGWFSAAENPTALGSNKSNVVLAENDCRNVPIS